MAAALTAGSGSEPSNTPAGTALGAARKPLRPLLLVAAVYLCLTFLIEGVYAIAERRGTPLRRSLG